MGGGRIVFLTLIGGGTVALTAFAVKYYLSRKARLTDSVIVNERSSTKNLPEVDKATGKQLTDSSEKADLPRVDAASPVSAAVDEHVAESVEDTVDASDIVCVEADESASTPYAFPTAHPKDKNPALSLSIPASGLDPNPTLETTPIISIGASIVEQDPPSNSTPPSVSIAFLTSADSSANLIEGAKGTPPTPPSTPMPPSRGDEDVVDSRANAMDLIQAAIQGRLEAVKPRYISTDSTGGDKDDEDVKEAMEGVDAVAVGAFADADAPADERVAEGKNPAVVDPTVKLQPISEESGVGSQAVDSRNTVAAADAAEKDAFGEETKPKSPYMRRKRRSVQPELEDTRILQESQSTSKAAATATAATAETSELTPPLRTPRTRRRSDRRSTGEIKITDDVVVSSSQSVSPSGSSDSSGCDVEKGDQSVSVSSGSGTLNSSGSALDSINDYSFMSDAEAAVFAAPQTSEIAAPAAPGEVDLLEGIEDASLDDLLRDISSMSESTTALMTTSMMVEVDHPFGDDRKTFGAEDDLAEVDEDLAIHLNLVDESVLDDHFYGAPSNEIDYTQADLVVNDPKSNDELEEFDMRVSIGFKENGAMIASTDGASMITSTDGDPTFASTDDAAMISTVDTDTLSTHPDAMVDDAVIDSEGAAVADGASSGKMTKNPKRVVRPRKERQPLDGAFGVAKATKDSADGSSSSSAKKTSTSSSTKSPPAKAPRGSTKRTGIPRPGSQP